MGDENQRLDMRFNQLNPDNPSALDIVNNSSLYDLSEILKKFGEERYHEKLAAKIVEAR